MSKLVSLVFILNTLRSKFPSPQVKSFFVTGLNTIDGAQVIDNCVLDTVTGYIFDSNYCLIEQSTSWGPQHAITRMPLLPRFPRKVKSRGPIIFLGSEAYYHWLLEDFPAFLRAEISFPEAIVGVRRSSSTYVSVALSVLGKAPIVLPIYSKISQLVISPKAHALSPQEKDIKLLEEFQLTAKAGIGNVKKIYISRRDSGRYPDNEADVETLVEQFGYQIVQLTKISFLDQINLLAGATHVIGTHGAGLSNIVWMPRNSGKVVEISQVWQPDCFEQIARIKGIEYVKVASSTQEDWKVNLSQLEDCLRKD